MSSAPWRGGRSEGLLMPCSPKFRPNVGPTHEQREDLVGRAAGEEFDAFGAHH